MSDKDEIEKYQVWSDRVIDAIKASGHTLVHDLINDTFTVVPNEKIENERLRSVLKDARNILHDGKYLFAFEIDKVLGEQAEHVSP